MLKLCFGVEIPIETLLETIGGGDLHCSIPKVYKCTYCRQEFGDKPNFCSNCGTDLRESVRILTPSDVVEFALQETDPPKTIWLIPTGAAGIAVCQILVEGDTDHLVYNKPSAHFAWKPGVELIHRYMTQLGLETEEPRLFVLAEKEK